MKVKDERYRINGQIKNLNFEEIYNDYVYGNLTVSEIAKKNKIGITSLMKFLKNNNIPHRTTFKAGPLVGKKYKTIEVTKYLGKVRSHYEYEVFCYICKKISIKRSDDIRKEHGCVCQRPNRWKRHKDWKGYENLSGVLWRKIEWGAFKRNLELSITKKEIWDLYIKQNKKCALSGIDIVLDVKPKNNTASLDRIDSSKGYTIDNVQWVHKIVNRIKWDLSDKELIKWCELIYLNNKDKQ